MIRGEGQIRSAYLRSCVVACTYAYAYLLVISGFVPWLSSQCLNLGIWLVPPEWFAAVAASAALALSLTRPKEPLTQGLLGIIFSVVICGVSVREDFGFGPLGVDLLRIAVLFGLALLPMWVLRKPVVTERFPERYLPTLDGWRAVAISLVMIDHTVGGITGHGIALGQHGVNLFFGVSGFLITTKLLEEKNFTGRISLISFYRRRVFRIAPAALCFLFTVALLSLAKILLLSRLELAGSLMFFRNWMIALGDNNITKHFWSLSLEEQFYLVIPLIVAITPGPRLLKLLAGGAVLVEIVRTIYFSYHPDVAWRLDMRYRTDLRADGLLLGCAAAVALQDERARKLLNFCSKPMIWAFLALAWILVLVMEKQATTLIESLLVPLLVVGTVTNHDIPISRLLEFAPLRWVGRISYSLYLWQQLFLFPNFRVQKLGSLTAFPQNVILVFALASLSYYLVERPVLRWARNSIRAHENSNVSDAALATT